MVLMLVCSMLVPGRSARQSGDAGTAADTLELFCSRQWTRPRTTIASWSRATRTRLEAGRYPGTCPVWQQCSKLQVPATYLGKYLPTRQPCCLKKSRSSAPENLGEPGNLASWQRSSAASFFMPSCLVPNPAVYFARHSFPNPPNPSNPPAFQPSLLPAPSHRPKSA